MKETTQYSHVYYDEAGHSQRRIVTRLEYLTHKPDGHLADGSPYWNYNRETRTVIKTKWKSQE